MKRFVVVFAALLAVTLATSVFAAESGKLGYVDIQKILNTSDAGKSAKEQLSAKVKKYKEEIDKKQADLAKLKDVLEKQGQLLSESAKSSKEKEYQQLLKDLQRMTKDAQDELQAKDEELTKNILVDIEKVVQEYGAKNGYSFIFIRNESMIYVDEKADLTDPVLTLVNQLKK